MSDSKKTDSRLTYQNAGVDPDKAADILATFAKHLSGRPKDPALLSGIGPFAACYSLKDAISGMTDPLLVTCCDGVGTKAKLALEWGHIDDLGYDLVGMNINDLLCVGAKPMLFLDYYACGKLTESQLLPLLKSIQRACEISRCSLAGGETAEMPGMYRDDDFDLAGFAVGMVDRNQVLGAPKVKAGDRLLALASSGLHSNGYSLVRKIAERAGLTPDGATPFGEGSWRESLLKPTTLYVDAVSEIFPKLHALAHITGGGLYENLPRVLPGGSRARIKSSAWPFPKLFAWLQGQAALSTHDMLCTFNCGVGMIAVCPENEAGAVAKSVESRGVRCWEIGTIEMAGATSAAPVVSWE